MADVSALIADMVRAGVDPELIGRTAEALSHREAVLIPDEAAQRRRARDAERKRLRKSAEIVGEPRIEVERPSPKEAPPAPPEEITPSNPSTHKETPLRGSKKGSRLPSDFLPDIEWAVGAGLPRQRAEIEAATFRDFWTAKAGRDGAKLDWPATWRVWVRKSMERLAPRAGPAGKPNPGLAAVDALMEKLDAAASSQTEANQAYPRLVAFSGGG